MPGKGTRRELKHALRAQRTVGTHLGHAVDFLCLAPEERELVEGKLERARELADDIARLCAKFREKAQERRRAQEVANG